jgi:ribonuclease R
VSHFVAAGGFIDSEARRRGNSFYFPDRSIPMLPERLSSDLCSLRPDVDRLALVVEMRLSSDGGVVDALFHEGIIRSRARLAYEEAAAWLEDSSASDGLMPEWGTSLRCLDRIATDLGRQRVRAGALTLDLPEVEIVIDEAGHPIDACIRGRNRAHILIEEAMLAANRAVARALDRAERKTVHRVHPPPPPHKLEELARLLERLGIDVKGELETPGVLAQALDEIRGQPSEERVHMAALRSMSQARYEAVSRGHYALRFDHYLHFTSPIRRYADLDVHRALRRLIRGEVAEAGSAAMKKDRVERLSIWLSGRERLATDAERDADAMACCALMSGREGERFKAEVTGATEYGLFIRVERPSVSGLVPMRVLEGRWEVDEADEALADGTGARIAVGDSVHVRLLSVDVDRGRLAFRLQSEKGTKGANRSPRDARTRD